MSYKKIQNKITRELKPTRSFDAFCEEHGIEQTVEMKSHGRATIWKKTSILLSVVVAAALCICLPLALTNKTNTNEIVFYGDADVSFQVIDPELLQENNKLFICDNTKIASYSEIKRIFPINNEDLTVGYIINEIIFGFEYQSDFYAYEFTYIVRSYSGYEFTDIDLYLNPQVNFDFNGTRFSYSIDNQQLNAAAYITFEIDDYNYYLYLQNFEEITAINNNTVEIFIENLRGEQL